MYVLLTRDFLDIGGLVGWKNPKAIVPAALHPKLAGPAIFRLTEDPNIMLFTEALSAIILSQQCLGPGLMKLDGSGNVVRPGID